MNLRDLQDAARRMRGLARAFVETEYDVREQGFRDWCRDTLYPSAVNRWVREIGERA